MNPQQLWDKSADAWISLLEKGHKNRDILLDPVMLRLAGDVQGKDVCDLGCGEGRFCRLLSASEARPIGIEPTATLLDRAKSLDPNGRYVHGVGETIPLASSSVDLAIAYLVLIDIGDYRAAIAELVRITKPGGRILIANINSFASTLPNPWIRDDKGRLCHLLVKDYFGERADIVAWAGIEIVNYHRPFEDYMKALLGHGLRLLDFEEPCPGPETLAEHPDMLDSSRTPNFYVMQWLKE